MTVPTRTPKTTTGSVHYIQQPPPGQELYAYVYIQPPDGKEVSNARKMDHKILIEDLRSKAHELSLEKNGVELHKLNTPEGLNWEDEAEVKARFYPEVAALLKNATGATRVEVFDHGIRTGKVKLAPGKIQPPQKQEPADTAHVDYTTVSGVERLDVVLPDEADKLRQTPFAIIQVWKPLKGPVKSSPLGIIDASSVKAEDFISVKLFFEERTGFTYVLTHSPEHKWYYAADMQPDEAYVIMGYHSQEGRARFTPHAAFLDDSVDPDAPPRESIELRCYCFYEDQVSK